MEIASELTEEFEKSANYSIKLRNKVNNIIKNKRLTKQQAVSLVELAFGGKAKLKDLAEKTGISKQTLCMMYNNLEEKGVVTRGVDEKDRRNTYYKITEKGIALLRADLEDTKKVVCNLLDKTLTSDEVFEFLKSLRKMNSFLQKCLGE